MNLLRCKEIRRKLLMKWFKWILDFPTIHFYTSRHVVHDFVSTFYSGTSNLTQNQAFLSVTEYGDWKTHESLWLLYFIGSYHVLCWYRAACLSCIIKRSRAFLWPSPLTFRTSKLQFFFCWWDQLIFFFLSNGAIFWWRYVSVFACVCVHVYLLFITE